MMSLEDWAPFDKEHSISLLGAIEALKASTLRLPVIGGAHVCYWVTHYILVLGFVSVFHKRSHIV